MNQIATIANALPSPVSDRGITPEAWRVMKTVLYPDASDEMTLILHDYCTARGLDPLKKPFHVVKVWDSKKREMAESIWPSISEGRITAMRTGEYAGMDSIEHGPTRTENVGTESATFPEWAQCTVYRLIGGHRCAFAGPRVYWLETYAKKKGTDPTPNYMWSRRPFGQIDKCAEAAALRVAFPEENTMPTAEEMEGQTVGFDNARDITPKAEPARRPSSKAGKKAAPAADMSAPPEGEIVDHDPGTGEVIDPLSAVEDDLPPEEFEVWLGDNETVNSTDLKQAASGLSAAMKKEHPSDRTHFLVRNSGWIDALPTDTQNYLNDLAAE